jgi:DNA replication and repair protein RecF
LIARGAERFVVVGGVELGLRQVTVGIEWGGTGLRAKVAGQWTASLAELASTLPVQIIDPEVHKLIEEGPARRRRYLDWGVFHVEPDFMDYWQRFHQVLRQRNAALKGRQPAATVAAWNADFVRYGEKLTEARRRYVGALAGDVAMIGRNLLEQEVGISYRAGWPKDRELAEALAAGERLDAERGFTQLGPQRADLQITLGGLPVRDRISRGQQKLLSAALLLAQIRIFPPLAAARPTLLLDDPAAELDDQRLAALIREVSSKEIQLIVTALHADFSGLGSPGRRYRLMAGAAVEI